jgi:hypothetical protein
MRSMTSQGSPYARLKRAIAQRNPTIALATAAELPKVPLADALALCLLLLDRQPAHLDDLCTQMRLSDNSSISDLASFGCP